MPAKISGVPSIHDVGSAKSEHPKLIIFEEFQPVIAITQRHGQTDKQTT